MTCWIVPARADHAANPAQTTRNLLLLQQLLLEFQLQLPQNQQLGYQLLMSKFIFNLRDQGFSLSLSLSLSDSDSSVPQQPKLVRPAGPETAKLRSKRRLKARTPYDAITNQHNFQNGNSKGIITRETEFSLWDPWLLVPASNTRTPLLKTTEDKRNN